MATNICILAHFPDGVDEDSIRHAVEQYVLDEYGGVAAGIRASVHHSIADIEAAEEEFDANTILPPNDRQPISIDETDCRTILVSVHSFFPGYGLRAQLCGLLEENGADIVQNEYVEGEQYFGEPHDSVNEAFAT